MARASALTGLGYRQGSIEMDVARLQVKPILGFALVPQNFSAGAAQKKEGGNLKALPQEIPFRTGQCRPFLFHQHE
jgi:hypothetical protein